MHSNQVEIPVAQFFAALDAMEWSGSPCPADPDNFWIDDDTGERVCAKTGVRTAPVLPTFSVTLNFRKGPSFSERIKAADEQSAITLARRFAAQCGMGGAERKPTVYEVQA
jgi:hypothetical protein